MNEHNRQAALKAIRFFLIFLACLPIIFVLKFTGLLGLPGYFLMPGWVTSNKTDGSFTQALRTEMPVGTSIPAFTEKLEKIGFKPGWSKSQDGHSYAIYGFGILPCGITWTVIYDVDENGNINFLNGRVSRACL